MQIKIASGVILAMLVAVANTATAEKTTIVSVASGGGHTCALTHAGSVKCWGAHEAGQLGDGTFTQSVTPVTVVGLSGGAVAIAAGDEFSCALTNLGSVQCWGSNGNGQLGDGDAESASPTPVNVVGLGALVTKIAAGVAHACAILDDGGVKCWGFNGGGQLGDGSTIDQATPVDVVGLTQGIRAMALGYDHSCALTTAHGIKCWGTNGFGQFGDGSNTDSYVPVDGGLTSAVSTLTAGDWHTCAIATEGALKCWGLNLNGQIGSGSSVQTQLVPASVVGLSHHVVAVSGGGLHTCALTNGGQFCFGSNSFGQLGDDATEDTNVPVKVKRLDGNASTISAGSTHTCAILTNGRVKCWGQNFNGELGDGTTTDRDTPVAVIGL